jgi:hypothetical protein
MSFILENFLLNFCHLATKRKGAVNHTKDSFGNDDPKSLCFQNKILKSPNLDHMYSFGKDGPKSPCFPPKAMRFCKRKIGPKVAMFPKTKKKGNCSNLDHMF